MKGAVTMALHVSSQWSQWGALVAQHIGRDINFRAGQSTTSEEGAYAAKG